ncbi:MAG: hypothetical protein SVR08_18730 [Spirochaetota bacterium]|nr:hypothetical protein [Spirochaetota bacterium]
MRIVRVPTNEKEMHFWEEKGSEFIHNELSNQISEIDSSIKLSIKESDIGIGASWPSIIIDILEIGGLVFVGAPVIHKKVRETLSEWAKIKGHFDKLFSWLKKNKRIESQSIEVAYLKALEHLSKKTNVMDLEVIEAQEILGKSGSIEPDFENTELIYYCFKFKNSDSKLYSLIIDNHMTIKSDVDLHLDPFEKFHEESKNKDKT